MKFLVTGGSGFIGTNLVEYFLDANYDVLSIDIKGPQNTCHRKVFRMTDVLDKNVMQKVFDDFKPTHVIHLAARTDLNGKSLDDYTVNTTGVENIITAISRCPTVERCIFTSSKSVCTSGYMPVDDDDYHPVLVYAKSKVICEQLVKKSSLDCEWCIVRPTSIWGPWFDVPYKGFFLSVARGWYIHPGGVNGMRNYGYVGNTVYQLCRLLECTSELIHRHVFYLSDYTTFRIQDWANMISNKLRKRNVFVMPGCFIRIAALLGDIFHRFGWDNPPITSYRLENMKKNTANIPLGNPIRKIVPSLPYSMEEGVERTIEWLHEMGHV